jgi:hypothetical protein
MTVQKTTRQFPSQKRLIFARFSTHHRGLSRILQGEMRIFLFHLTGFAPCERRCGAIKNTGLQNWSWQDNIIDTTQKFEQFRL